MKLRLQGNSLRLRLNRPEVARLAAGERVEETVAFGPGKTFSYSIESGSQAGHSTGSGGIQAGIGEHNVFVRIPSELASEWAESDQVGIEDQIGPLKILIEKDFQCTHSSRDEDRDSFPNPLATPK